MRFFLHFSLIFLFAIASSASAQSCRVIHGRAILYTGDGQLRTGTSERIMNFRLIMTTRLFPNIYLRMVVKPFTRISPSAQ